MEEGDLVKLNCFKNGKDEAIGISDEIEKKLKKKYSFNEMAILVRAIFQTREFEERFLKIGMPYRILGGTKFYERAEIKDCVAYLRLIHQEKDDLAFERIVNNPKRSIGDTSLKTVHEFGKENNLSLESAANKMLEQNLIKPKTKIGLSFFLNALNKWRNDLNIKKINHIEKNYLKILKLFLKTKYVWGGKTYRGIDCSAILQLFFYYNNKFYPRDTKDQIKYSAKKNRSKVFKKGDIIFWKGHVAVCINAQKLIHAYGPEKKVLIMNIKETINRIERTAKLTVKKISPIKY